MRFEKVHTVRELYDGVRSGTADLKGVPHYFSSLFNSAADDWTEHFRLYPLTVDFMERELRSWSIYRAWEAKYHTGLVPLNTHPGHGGIDLEYDMLTEWLNQHIKTLVPLDTYFTAIFRERTGQDDLPYGILRERDVAWSPAKA